uniref:TRUD domain-containing protein n=1 Tax=Culex tarsalis TaxID=7177 RepID=A0A1Q3EZN6_CULTA
MGRNNFQHRGGGGRGRGGNRNNPFKKRGGGGGGGGHQNRPPFNRNNKDRNRRDAGAVLSELKEEQVFVTEYVTPGEGFRGILKSRYSDFHVNEIDVDGKEAVLTELKLPEQPKEDNLSSEKELVELITQEKLDQIRKVAESKGKCADVVEIDVTEMSKEDRGKIHNGAKGLFGSAIVGSTVTKDDRKFVTFAQFDKSKVRDKREKWLWPEEFTHFLLYKENVDTIQATTQLTENLRCSPSAFAYAGTKDRRAKTTQWVSIRHGDPARIAAAAAKMRNVKLGNFCFKPAPLKLGQLRGNRFRIVLRQVTAGEDVLRSSLDDFREKGFINYFGLQRFGNCASIPTYKVGIEILKGEWKEACDLILKPREGDPWFMQQVREIWQKTGDAQAAFDKFFYSNKSIEKTVLKWLASHENDFRGALEHLPRNMRLLYSHSYQSVIWNRVASRRIRDLGYRLVPGDLVFVDKSSEEVDLEPVLDVDAALEQDEPVQQEDKEEPEQPEHPTEVSRFKSLVKPLTEADIESGAYTIFDIVLPLPGHDIAYPANECATWYEELLAADGLSSEKLKQKTKMHSLTGAYRKVFIKPENLDWKLVSYEKPNDALILSDLEKLNGEPEPVPAENAPHKALLLDFRLPSSAYATMALREILKVDTSALYQRALEKQDTPESAPTEETEAPKDGDDKAEGNGEAAKENEQPEAESPQGDGEAEEPVEKRAKLD